MKIFSILLVGLSTLFGGSSFAQARPVFDIKIVGQQDTLIRGWQLHKGDSLAGAGWVGFNPSTDIKGIDLPGVNWLRVTLRKDSAMGDTLPALLCRQFVASEVYLDGKLIAVYGALRPNVVAYTPHDEPLVLRIRDYRPHVLAVRFALPAGVLGFRSPGTVFPVFEASVSTERAAFAEKEDEARENFPKGVMFLVFAGIFLILTIVHLATYGWYTRHKAHLYYGLSTLVGVYVSFLNYWGTVGIHSPLVYQWGHMIALTLQLTIFTFTFTVYALFGYRDRKTYWFLISFSLFAMLILWLKFDYGLFLAFVVVPLVNTVETVRVGIWARRRNLPGAWFVVSGICAFFILLSVSSFCGRYGYMVLGLAELCFPVGMAVFLAIQSATTIVHWWTSWRR